MEYYSAKVSACTNFYCQGCVDFADYLQKAGIATITSTGVECAADDPDANVNLEDLLTSYDATESTLNILATNFNSNYTKTVDNKTYAFFQGFCTEQYTEEWIGRVTVTYTLGDKEIPINLVLPGTTPHYNLRASYTTAGTYTLTRTSSKITVTKPDGSTEDLTTKIDGVIPLRVVIECCGGGGGGAGSYNALVYFSGGGGGGGGYACAVLDFASDDTITVNVGEGGSGGYKANGLSGSTADTQADDGGTTTVKAGSTTLVTATGGSGGANGTPSDGGSGGSGSVAGTAWEIETSDGAAGGAAKTSGGGTSVTLTQSDIFINNTISRSESGGISGSGDNSSGGGGASVMGTGMGSGGTQGPGGGGKGGDAGLFDGNNGSSGAAGGFCIRY